MTDLKESCKNVFKNLDEKRGLWCVPGGGACSTCPDLQWKVYAVTALGFFAASYDLFNILFLTPSMGRRYFQDLPTFMKENVRPGILPLNYEAAIISSLLVGAIIGSVTGGALADVYGRKFIFEGACYIMILFAFLSSYSFGASGAAVVGTLSFWRFFLGMGIGAMYPVSAIIMSEYSTRKSRGAFVAIVFAMQGTGILFSGLVAGIANAGVGVLGPSNDFPIVGVYGFGCPAGTPFMECSTASIEAYESAVIGSCPNVIEFVWRATVGVGAIPAIIALLLSKYLLVETPRFTSHVKKDHLRAITDLASQGEPYAQMVTNVIEIDNSVEVYPEADLTCCGFLYFHGWNLITVSVSWFLFNTAFYSFIIAIKDAAAVTGFVPIQQFQSAQAVTDGTIRSIIAFTVAALIPGYYVVVLTVDLIGRKLLQFLGFVLFALFLSATAGGRRTLLQPNNASQYDYTPEGQSESGINALWKNKANGWVLLFVFSFFFASWGPLTTTYIIPAEIFPTRWRGTGYGMASAFGILGSITGVFGFLYASQPGMLETQYAYPCNGDAIPSDLNIDGSCKKLNFCPLGRTVPGGDLPGGSPAGSECRCNLNSKSGCANFGLGPGGAMGVLVTLLIAGAISTLALPLTTQRSLEDINFQNETEAPREFVMFDTFDAEGVVMKPIDAPAPFVGGSV